MDTVEFADPLCNQALLCDLSVDGSNLDIEDLGDLLDAERLRKVSD
ncbi:hypothetical protein [Roseovarius indicus]